MSKKSWYKRKHQFTPYTKADGQAVSDEFDAIQTSFERIPEMRDDGRGFKESPLIPEPTDPMHPVPLKMLTETEKSVNNARDDVIAKAQQVAQNTQSVATNTLTATQKADTATQAAASAQSSQQEASNSENMAHKWAANPVDETVQGDKYSAYHYATKAAQSATTASSAAITSKSNADIATNKAEEAAQSAKRAESLANGEIEYEKVLNVPSADTQTKGVVQLTSSLESGSESLGLTAKAGKYISELIGNVKTSLSNFILKTSLSSEVNVESEDSVATSLAVKKAYDKAVEANNNADNKVPKNGDTTINGTLKVKNTSGGWSAYQFETSQGFWQLEVHPNSHENANRRFNMVYVPNSGNRVYLLFPALGNNGEVVAYQSWAVNKAGDSMTGILYSVGISSKHYGYGNYANQYTSGAPFLVNAEGSQDRDTYHPFVKGLVRSRGRYGAGFSFGYTTKQGAGDGFGRGVIHLVEDNGSNKTWIFEHNGDFVAPSDVLTARGKSLNNSTQLSDFSYQKIGNFEVRKYPDGTMIQTNVVNFRGGYSHGTVYSFNWAVSFVEAPAVFGSNKAVEDFSFVDKNQMGIKTKSNGSTYYYYLYDPGGEQGDWDMQFLAIGRWKR
ncbi:phage tail protein [Haemophilus parainfluenzae]|uniref:phage tail protein n=1 Tax=Haemophilus parainfluenzae TaxID=729 RepID=UPI000DAD675F|nr:phage tail protein [Haemophilus parainfluenzae]RDE78293.1 hypothetical protein DPV94_00465 [Haemophilus parainfluenzae]DAX78744.1 MAG TPA: hypothetical protein [Caudoviricetes sp.]